MKNLKHFLSILIMLFMSISLFGQFKAKMVFNSMGKERAFTVYSADDGYRYEFNENGQKGIVIVQKGLKGINYSDATAKNGNEECCRKSDEYGKRSFTIVQTP